MVGHSAWAFLDIETTGLSPLSSQLVLVGLLEKSGPSIWIKDVSLVDVSRKLSELHGIITFNGLQFDWPFLQCVCPGLGQIPQHVDLRNTLSEIGIYGGLKQVEKKVGYCRPAYVQEINGKDAPRLWKRWQEEGSFKHLRMLITHNLCDVYAMATIAHHILAHPNDGHSLFQYAALRMLESLLQTDISLWADKYFKNRLDHSNQLPLSGDR